MSNYTVIKNINLFLNKLPLWYYLIPYILHIISTNLLTDKFNDVKSYKPLYDAIMSNTPDLSDYENVSNYLFFFIAIFLIIPLYIKPNNKIFISLFKYFSVLVLLRSITSYVTILPSQTSKCKNNLGLLRYINGHCIDKIFSGHTATSLIIILMYHKYNIISKNMVYFLLGIQFLLAISLIVTRGHYTIDVVIAYLITIFVYLLFDL